MILMNISQKHSLAVAISDIRNMVRTTLILFILIFTGSTEAAEPAVLGQFFGHSGISNKPAVYTGEMLKYYVDKPTLGEGLPATVEANFRVLNQSENNAVYAVLLSDGRRSQDWYAFLIRENKVWKLSAVRQLALTGMTTMVLHRLEQKSARTKEEEWQYQNMRLTLKSDSDLKAYLKQKLTKFKQVVALYSTGHKDQAQTAAKQLYIDSVNDRDGLLDLNIGGITDNAVGYLYIPPGKQPPAMSPNDFIYVEQIIDGWYIYKTT